MAATLIYSAMDRQAEGNDEANRCFLLLCESTEKVSKVITKLLFVFLFYINVTSITKHTKTNLIYLALAKDKGLQRTHHSNPLHLQQLTMQNLPGITCH